MFVQTVFVQCKTLESVEMKFAGMLIVVLLLLQDQWPIISDDTVVMMNIAMQRRMKVLSEYRVNETRAVWAVI